MSIFALLSRKELYNCLYVCKYWYSLVEPIYFKSIFWNARKITSLKKALLKADYNIQSFKPFPITERLVIGSSTDPISIDENDLDPRHGTMFSKKEFIFLLSRFDNLKCLNIERSLFKQNYLLMLGQCAGLKLEEIVLESDFLLYEKQIRYPLLNLVNDGDLILPLSRFTTQYHFRESLKHLRTRSIGCMGDESSFVFSLGLFNKLETLEVSNRADQLLTVFHLLNVCPDLSSVAYSSTIKHGLNEAQSELNTMMEAASEKRVSASQIFKYLKKVKLSVPAPAEVYTDFFENFSPRSLNSVEINFTEFDVDEYMDDEDNRDTIFDFCKAIQKYNSVRLTLTINTATDENLKIDDAYIDYFYDLVDLLAGERNLHCSAVYRYGDIELGPEVDISICDSEMIFMFHLDWGYDELSNVPVPKNLKKLAKINHFKLVVEDGEHDSFPKNYLDYVRSHCPQLTRFQIDDESSNCLFKAECLSPLNPSLGNMTSITIDENYYSEELISGLLEYCPRIEVINYTTEREYGREVIALKLTGFVYLHTLVFNLKESSGPKKGSFCVRYTDNERSLQWSPCKYLNWDTSHRVESPVVTDVNRASKGEKINYTVNIEGVISLKKIELRKNSMIFTTLILQ